MSVPNIVMQIRFVKPLEQLHTDFLKEKYGRGRRFYSCRNTKFNYVSYVQEGSEEKINYVAYSGDGEKSSGVFGKNGLIDEHERHILKENLRKTQSVIWHGFISFEEKFGQKYMGSVEDAISLMNKEMPVFLRDAGFKPENIVWYAGLHENTTKKHIHISFFELEPTRYRQIQGTKELHFSEGRIYKPCFDRFKIRIEQRLTNISAELKIARKELLDSGREILFSKSNKNKYMLTLQDKMLSLSKRLPETGSLSYNSENMAPLRDEIKQIVNILPKLSPRFYTAFDGYMKTAMRNDEATRQMLITQGIDKKHWPEYLTADKLLEDMYRRIGNYVINSVKYFKKKGSAGKSKYVCKRLRKRSTLDILDHCARLAAEAEREAMEAFNDYIDKLEEGKEAEGEQEIEME